MPTFDHKPFRIQGALQTCTGLACLLSASLAFLSAQPALQPKPLLMAPMVSGLDACLQTPTHEPVHTGCVGPNGSAADLLNWTFRELGPIQAPQFQLGYTLKLPLLDFLRAQGDDWVVDAQAIQRVVRTLEQTERPTILYFFSNHFETGAAIEKDLARDPANLAHSPQGPLPIDQYYGARLYPWTVATTDNSLTHRREQVVQALSDALCAMPAPARERIAGITVLGETHQLYPHFENGMGFSSPYVLADYSNASVAGFRAYLKQRFGTLTQLNHALGSQFDTWDAINPPVYNATPTPNSTPLAFLDTYAHGVLPVTGWVAPDPKASLGNGQVRVYVDGRLHSRATIELSRQDVLAALPELGTANVGWRSDIDFSHWSTGPHQIDVLLERANTPLRYLGSRTVNVRPGAQHLSTPDHGPHLPAAWRPALPQAKALGSEELRHSLDLPEDKVEIRFNPMAKLWHAYRNQQVVDYLQHFQRLLATSCLGQKTLLTHQLIPYFNPSWDANRYAVDASLEAVPGMASGISLYGEPAYGETFFRWRQSAHRSPYGVTEYHPLQAMSPSQLATALERHRRNGAQFVSMFLEGHFHGILMSEHLNAFAFERTNKGYGSDVLYQSLQKVLNTSTPVEPALPALKSNSVGSHQNTR